jgi:transposase-like protein
MKNNPVPRRRTISIVQRGQIVQRVIVDGWSSSEVAAAFGVPRRLVEVWVADYRRHGMASLRRDTGRTIATIFGRSVGRPLRVRLHKIMIGVFGSLGSEHLGQPQPLRQSNKDGPW